MTDNRERILETALALFAARGFEAVSVQEIVESVGITKPTLYHYYGSKRGLLEGIFALYGERLCARAGAAARYDRDIKRTLENIASALAGFAQEHPAFYRLQLALHFAPSQSEGSSVARPWNERPRRVTLPARCSARLLGRHGRHTSRLATEQSLRVMTVPCRLSSGRSPANTPT